MGPLGLLVNLVFPLCGSPIFFSNFGIVENVSYDRRDHFAFVDFLSVDAAERAFHAMQGAVVGARKVRLAFGRVSDDDEEDEEDELLFYNVDEETGDSSEDEGEDFDMGERRFYYGGAFSTRDSQLTF